mmetsp:Transcript_78481/g.205965  ORF Transcript_78481/g.205965 Transcript_78481/m.205965 type:complete len:212 (-) Transcript_78481:479-1114(-)
MGAASGTSSCSPRLKASGLSSRRASSCFCSVLRSLLPSGPESRFSITTVARLWSPVATCTDTTGPATSRLTEFAMTSARLMAIVLLLRGSVKMIFLSRVSFSTRAMAATVLWPRSDISAVFGAKSKPRALRIASSRCWGSSSFAVLLGLSLTMPGSPRDFAPRATALILLITPSCSSSTLQASSRACVSFIASSGCSSPPARPSITMSISG